MTDPHILDSDEDPVVDNLLPETFEAVAERLAVSDTFEERVYRECELDALWTLADIAIGVVAQKETGHAPQAWQQPAEGDAMSLVSLRALIEQAHELAVDAHVTEAAALVRQAARLCASWT